MPDRDASSVAMSVDGLKALLGPVLPHRDWDDFQGLWGELVSLMGLIKSRFSWLGADCHLWVCVSKMHILFAATRSAGVDRKHIFCPPPIAHRQVFRIALA